MNVLAMKVLPPPIGAYHGAYADFGPTENDVTVEKIEAFERLSGKKLAWAYFSNHWLDGEIKYPADAVEACKRKNVVPYIRVQPWSEMVQERKDPLFSMEAIIKGTFDEPLRQWAREAKGTNYPIMIEFGPEVNGDWFPWNGKWHGGGTKNRYGDPNHPDGPERFRDAYRHLIDIFRSEGAMNITWVLHVDAARSPHAEWNDVKYYYPGDEYIDWIGISVFGRQLPQNNWIFFPIILKNFIQQVEVTTRNKPYMISEYGVIEDSADPTRKAKWIKQAFQSISRGLFPNVRGMTYWNSPGWLSNGRASFKIDSSIEAREAYRTEISQPFWVDTAIISQ